MIRDLSSRNSVLPPAEFASDEEFIENLYPLGASRYSATIEARVVGSPRYNLLRQQRVIGRSRTLRFRLHTDAPEPYEVLWKVRNRGPEAAQVRGGLRGQIHVGGNKSRNVQEESTRYRGSHYVEVYVVRDGVVVATDHHEVTIT